MSKGWIGEVRQHEIQSIAKTVGLTVSRGQSYTPCPACKASRRSRSDSRGPVGVRSDGKGWRCWSCSVTGDAPDLGAWLAIGKPLKEASKLESAKVRSAFAKNGLCSSGNPADRVTPLVKVQPVSKPREAVPQAYQSPMRWYPELADDCIARLWSEEGKITLTYMRSRGFSDEAIKKWRIGSLSIKRNKGSEYYVAIPVLDSAGKPVNVRFRSVPHDCAWCGKTDPDCKKCKGTGVARKIYLRSPNRPSTLFGVMNLSIDTNSDVIICEGELDVMALWQLGFKENVVSGTAGAGTWADDWLDSLEPYRHFILAYDSDKAGDEGAAGVAAKLGKERCSRAKLPYKDAGECLERNVSTELIQKSLDSAQPLLEAGLVRVDNYTNEVEELIRNPDKLKGLTTGSQILDEALGGIRPGLWIVTGGTGQGKTTVTTWLMLEQARRGVPVLLTSFEQRPIGTVQKLLRAEIGGDFTMASEIERKDAMRHLGSMPIYMVDHYGALDSEELKSLIGYSVRRKGVRMAVVDHLGFLIDGAEDERRAIERVVRDYAVYAVQNDITIMLIVHPNNLSVTQQRRVMLTDLKGASAIRQDAHVGLVVERMLPGRTVNHPATAIHVDKCRSEFGLQGSRAVLAFDPEACVYADDWEQTPMGASMTANGTNGFTISGQ